MTYYERIQKAVDYIEEYLDAEPLVEEAAGSACLSVPHFYRLFPEFTGYSFKEYVRKRRLAKSLDAVLSSGDPICDIALHSGFGTTEAYTRAFNREFGINPSEYRKSAVQSFENGVHGLEPIGVVTEYYDKVIIKELDEIRVVSNTAVSVHPERDAWRPLERWARKENVLKKPNRIFGCENPPAPRNMCLDEDGNTFYTPVPGVAYGYEFMLTVDRDTIPSGGLAGKFIPAGHYAVMSAESTDYTDQWKGRAWARMLRLIESAGHKVKQYDSGPRIFEEHVQHFPLDEVIRLDLYIELE